MILIYIIQQLKKPHAIRDYLPQQLKYINKIAALNQAVTKLTRKTEK